VYGLTKDLHKIRPTLEMPLPDYKQILGADISDWIYNTYKWYFDYFGYRQ
jgi:hypothetical protein